MTLRSDISIYSMNSPIRKGPNFSQTARTSRHFIVHSGQVRLVEVALKELPTYYRIILTRSLTTKIKPVNPLPRRGHRESYNQHWSAVRVLHNDLVSQKQIWNNHRSVLERNPVSSFPIKGNAQIYS